MTRISVKLATAAGLVLALGGCASEATPREGEDNPMGQNASPSTGSPAAGTTNGMQSGTSGGTVRDPANGASNEMGGGGETTTAGTGGGTMMSSGGTEGGDVDCSQLAAPSNPDDMISTFEDGTGATLQVAGRGGGFYMFNDGSGMQDPPTGSLPPARMMSRCGGQYALCMSGSGFTEWGAGMGTDLGPLVDTVKQPIDLSGFTGIAFWARVVSGASLVRVALKDANTAPEGGVCDEAVASGEGACNDDWGKQINLTTEWQAYTLPFSELRQAGWGAAYDAFDATAVYSIQYQVGPNLEFDLCIDDLMLVR